MSTYLFNLCPEGNDFESHRIWESLLFNCTPIVEKNNVNDNFYNMGVPLIMLDKWKDLESLEIKDLNSLNQNNKNKNYETFSSLNFWIDQINNANDKQIAYILGTKAQFIKSKFILKYLIDEGYELTVLDTGQHRLITKKELELFNKNIRILTLLKVIKIYLLFQQ